MTKNNKKTMIKTYKIPIIEPVSTSWKIFGEVAGDLAYTSIKIMNDAIEMHYLHQRERARYKKETGKNFSVKDEYGVSTYNTIINRALKER